MIRSFFLPLSVAGLALTWPLTAGATSSPAAPAPQVVSPAPTAGLQFIANQRQWDAPVLFAADVPGGRLFLERGRLVQARYDAAAVEAAHDLPRPAQNQVRIRAHAFAVEFVGADRTALVRGEEATGAETSYLLGADPSRWAARVPGYGGVRYQGLYPGTDLRLYAAGPDRGQVEYDFELAPGADPTRIRLRYTGQDRLRIVEGALVVTTSVGEVREQRPVAYQLDARGQRVAVRCDYALSADHTVRFALPAGYDRTRPLIIDPILVYASYTGSTAANWGFTATHDPQGNLYTGGIAFGVGYPTTTGAYDVSFNSSIDVAIMKFNPSAPTGPASRVWATYVGGSQEERPHSMVVDQQGNLVVLGTTASGNFPTTSGAYDRSYNNATDLVVFKLSPSGSSLPASTYLGGSGNNGELDNGSNLWNNYGDDYRGDVTIDAQNNVLLTSVTRSNNFPTQSAFQGSRGGNHDAVVTKLTAGLTGLVWSSYLGGSSDDGGYSIQVDTLGGVYVGGGTASTNMPGMNGFRSFYGGGSADGYVVRISPSGTTRTNGTYLGTSAYDQAYFVQLDRQGAVYVLGQTAGAYPVSAGVYSNPGSRQFIQKLPADLSSSVLSTVIGNGNPSTSRPNLSPTAFLVDNCGQILLSGWGGGNITGMPTTPDAIQRNVSNSSGAIQDAYGYFYVMQLSSNVQGLVYGTYYGNGTTHSDGGTSRFDKRGVVYQSVCVRETSGTSPLLTTPNAWARTKGATGNNAAFKMDVLQLHADFVTSNLPNGSPNRTGCAPLLRYFNRPPGSNLAGSTAFWDFGNGQTSTAPDNVSTTYLTPGRYIVRLVVTNTTGCQQGVIATDTVDVQGVAKPALGADRQVCPGASITLSVPNPDPTATYAWRPALDLNTTSGPTVTATPTQLSTTYIVEATSAIGGCTASDTLTVLVQPMAKPALGPDQQVCPGASVTLSVANADSTATYVWQPATGLNTTTGTSVTATPAQPTTYIVQVTSAAGGCTATDTLTVNIAPAPQATIAAAGTLVTGQPITFPVTLTSADPLTSTSWNFGDGETSTDPAPTHTYTAAGAYTVQLQGATAAGCTLTTSVSFTVEPDVHPNIITPNGDHLNDTFEPGTWAGGVKLTVFNRWGRKVYEQANYTGGWGSDVAAGTYYYHLTTAAGQTMKGWLEVVR